MENNRYEDMNAYLFGDTAKQPKQYYDISKLQELSKWGLYYVGKKYFKKI